MQHVPSTSDREELDFLLRDGPASCWKTDRGLNIVAAGKVDFLR